MATLIIVAGCLIVGVPIGASIGRWWAISLGLLAGLLLGYGWVGDDHTISAAGWTIITTPLFCGSIALGVLWRRVVASRHDTAPH